MASLQDNLATPAAIKVVSIHGATNTRRSLLDHAVKPLVDADRNAAATLGVVLARIQQTVTKLERYDIFLPGTEAFLSYADGDDGAAATAATAADLNVAFKVKERPRLKMQVGTTVGDGEGSAYTNATVRNLFGGAETLSVNASKGTRTRSAYQVLLSAPVNGSPDVRVGLEALHSATQKPWASHAELLTGASLRLGWLTRRGDSHAVQYSGVWRQVTGLAAGASPTVRADAGDSVKSAITHTFTRDRRDNASLPCRGYVVKTVTELAGWGPLQGDVSFCKSEVEVGGALPVAKPWLAGVSVGSALRLGLLYPLPAGYSATGTVRPSRINDRFRLGGPTDVRGFDMGGLGPHDGRDAVGGDVYAAGGVNMLVPLPRLGADSPLRLQVFVNGGRLVALPRRRPPAKAPEHGEDTATMHSSTVWRGMRSALGELATGLPSTTAGLGLVYAHAVARVELNFSLPLVVRRMEESRKGLQFGVGIELL